MLRQISKLQTYSVMLRYGIAPSYMARNLPPPFCHAVVLHRQKYTQNNGVKGLTNRKHQFESVERSNMLEYEDCGNNNSSINIEDSEYDLLASEAMNVARRAIHPQNVLVIQPYVKWSAKRSSTISPDDQLLEANALIRSITNWRVALSIKVPLESLQRKALFGKGKIEELKTVVQELRTAKSHDQQPLTCIFVSKGTLSFAQKVMLESIFKLPVMDRYSVVIQILRLHATSAEAQIQVAMAEIPYIWAQVKDANISKSTKLGYSLNDTQRQILKSRERKLRIELDRLRAHRKLLRNKRKQNNYPIIAVIGYTNAGKTSIIKALTQEQSIQPRDQLFATLDVTAHAGRLPCNLEVIYMDTVGFMSDLPTGLIECFISTLEDAMLADVILHVQDVAHNCSESQKQHVEQTLNQLAGSLLMDEDRTFELPTIINVGNKTDLLNSVGEEFQGFLVSAKKQSGLDALQKEIEKQVLRATQRSKMKVRVPSGGSEMAWLYKNSAVMNISSQAEDAQYVIMDILIKESVLQQFKKLFCH